MTMVEYSTWRDDNPDWDKDWNDWSSKPRRGWRRYDKLKKTHPGWNDVLYKASKAPRSNVKPI